MSQEFPGFAVDVAQIDSTRHARRVQVTQVSQVCCIFRDFLQKRACCTTICWIFRKTHARKQAKIYLAYIYTHLYVSIDKMFGSAPVDPFALCNFLLLRDSPFRVFAITVEPDQDEAVDLTARPSAHLSKIWHYRINESMNSIVILALHNITDNLVLHKQQTMLQCWLLVGQFKLSYVESRPIFTTLSTRVLVNFVVPVNMHLVLNK